tara:strand:- start:3046 stop:3630 length:585 start_codon:yes stop_codon:yes gene_type:complete
MANPDIVRGLIPAGMVGGGAYNGAFREYSVAAGNGVAIFVGDPVTTAGVGTAQTIDGRVMLDVVQAATGDVITGVVVGVKPVTDSSLPYRAASTQRVLYVCDDPDVLFEIQEVSGGTALTANDLGLNADFVVGSGSTVTGYSGVELNNVGEAGTNTLDLKIVGFKNAPDNEIGQHAKWLVRLNRHRHVNQIAGI